MVASRTLLETCHTPPHYKHPVADLKIIFLYPHATAADERVRSRPEHLRARRRRRRRRRTLARPPPHSVRLSSTRLHLSPPLEPLSVYMTFT